MAEENLTEATDDLGDMDVDIPGGGLNIQDQGVAMYARKGAHDERMNDDYARKQNSDDSKEESSEEGSEESGDYEGEEEEESD